MDLPEERRAALREGVLAKSCICHDLAGTATRKNGIDPAATPAVCCGPNIVNFSRIATLREMVEHIYGRISLLSGSDRPHMFLRELAIYVDYLRNELAQTEDRNRIPSAHVFPRIRGESARRRRSLPPTCRPPGRSEQGRLPRST